ncbi:MAG: FecR domain-containing protein [Acidobacteria bacterium]|nr:FecR domain-containing protein [Acidobacteriota bacterium]
MREHHLRWRITIATIAVCLLSEAAIPASPADASEAGAVSALLPRGVAERSGSEKDLALHDAVLWNDLVKTIDVGRMRILLEDQSVLNIGARSSMRIVPSGAASQLSNLELEFGRFRAKVIEKAGTGGRVVITTPTAALGVVGTHFFVRGDEKEATIMVFEGEVLVRSSNSNIAGEQTLLAGELTTVLRDQPPTPKRPATPQEIQQAMEETLPAQVARFNPYQAPAGSDPRVVLSGLDLDRMPEVRSEGNWLELEPGPCATQGYVSGRLKLKPDLNPGPYEFTLDTPQGPRMGAFQVQPPASSLPPIGRMVHAPQVPAGALHRGVVVDEAGKPMAGARVKVADSGKESVVETDASGAFEVQTRQPGRIDVVQAKGFSSAASNFVQAGDFGNVSGIFSQSRLGERPLALATTLEKGGQGFSTYLLPADLDEGANNIALVEQSGNSTQRPVFVYRILGGRIDNPNLISGQQTQGEFIVCFGNALPAGQKLSATITGIGFIKFLGEGAKGQVVNKTISVAGQGTARIPFQIQATKGAGPGVPFFINLSLSGP